MESQEVFEKKNLLFAICEKIHFFTHIRTLYRKSPRQQKEPTRTFFSYGDRTETYYKRGLRLESHLHSCRISSQIVHYR